MTDAANLSGKPVPTPGRMQPVRSLVPRQAAIAIAVLSKTVPASFSPTVMTGVRRFTPGAMIVRPVPLPVPVREIILMWKAKML